MEKIIYLLWKPEKTTDSAFRDTLLQGLATELMEAGAVRAFSFNIDDERVSAAADKRMTFMQPPVDATLSVWLDCVQQADTVTKLLETYCERSHGYLVTESVPLKNTGLQSPPGEATPGMNQIVFLQIPEHMTRETWLDVWQNSHTTTAIETQSTFQYIQNVVVRALDDNAPHFDALVEECFPEQAMHDIAFFYDAVDDKEKLKDHATRMFESISRFIEVEKLTVLPMSEYVFRRL